MASYLLALQRRAALDSRSAASGWHWNGEPLVSGGTRHLVFPRLFHVTRNTRVLPWSERMSLSIHP